MSEPVENMGGAPSADLAPAGNDPSVAPAPEGTTAPAPEPASPPAGAGLRSAPDVSDTPEWKQALGNSPVLENFKSPDDFVKSYDEAQNMIRRSIRIPSQEAGQEAFDEFYAKLEQVPGVYRQPNPDDPEAVKQFYQRMGVPDAPDAYQFTNPEGFQPNPEADAGFKAVAHNLGLTPAQANGMREHLVGDLMKLNQSAASMHQEGMEKLNQEWGLAKDQNFQVAESTAAGLASKVDGLGDWLKSGHGKDPMVIKLMAAIGKMGGEMQAPEIDPNNVGAMTPADARAEISDIRNNPSHPFNNESDPAHDDAVLKMSELYSFATGGK